MAIKDKMDLAIGVAVGSSMQISLLVIPLSVILGWIIHTDMTLLFDNFQIAVLFVSIILVNYLIADGKSREFDPNCNHACLIRFQTGWRASFSWRCTSLLRLRRGSSRDRIKATHVPQSEMAAPSRSNGEIGILRRLPGPACFVGSRSNFTSSCCPSRIWSRECWKLRRKCRLLYGGNCLEKQEPFIFVAGATVLPEFSS